MEPRLQPMTPEVDPLVVTAVQGVRNRFGAEGLRDLIALAQMQLRDAEDAERRLAALQDASARPAEPIDSADTQAWLAYTEVDPDRDAGDRR